MNVLISNNDPTATHVVKRLLSRNHSIVEAGNGLAVIEALQKHDIDALVIEVQMPIMGALEVLQVVRDTPQFAQLPVIVLTMEADEKLVKQLLELGALGVILQAVRPERLAERLEPLIASLQGKGRRQTPSAGRQHDSHLSNSSVVVFADGDAEYRQHFRKVVGSQFKMLDAASGVQVLGMCLKSPPDAVFLGGGLGLMSRERIVHHLRSSHTKSVQLIAVCPKSELETHQSSGLYDEVIIRTYAPGTLQKEIDRLIRPMTAFDVFCQTIPDIRTRVNRAAEQVFGVMLTTDVEPTETLPASTEPRAAASITMTTDSFVVTVRTRFDMTAGRIIGGAFLEMDPASVSEEDVPSVAGEVSNVLIGRLKTAFEERDIDVTIGLPNVSVEPAGLAAATRDSGLNLYFKASDGPVTFQIDLSVATTQKGAAPTGVDSASGVTTLRSEG